MLNKILTVLLMVWITGCSSYRPLPISEPPAETNKVRTVPDYTKGGLYPADNIKQVKDNIKIYADWYMERSLQLRGYAYKASDRSLFGGIVGVIGGVGKSPETALAGGLISSGSSITTQRYQFLVQAENYEKASDVLYCMYRNVYPLPNDINVSADGILKMNQAIDELRIKLRKHQASITLAKPNLSELEASIKQELVNIRDREAITLQQNGLLTLAQQAQLDAAVEKELISKLVKCLAAY